jgi:molybdopterin-guanine dinucleotide biosynthesis protein A
MPSRDGMAAVVLAGGASRRMGRDKATMAHPTAGVTMVEHTVGTLAQRCAKVFVVAAPGQLLPPLDAVILRDEIPGAGPLPATGIGLRAARAIGVDRAFVSAVDMPNLSIELVDKLAAHTGVDVVLPWDGRDHYLAGVYRTELADRIKELVDAGERSMRALTGTVVTERVVIAAETPLGAALVNLNEPSELR